MEEWRNFYTGLEERTGVALIVLGSFSQNPTEIPQISLDSRRTGTMGYKNTSSIQTGQVLPCNQVHFSARLKKKISSELKWLSGGHVLRCVLFSLGGDVLAAHLSVWNAECLLSLPRADPATTSNASDEGNWNLDKYYLPPSVSPSLKWCRGSGACLSIY